jgi:hypothetical protein
MTRQWTPEAIRALGATTDLPTLGSIFGFSRWCSYQMAHTGEWEQAGIRIIRIGARYRVTVQSILAVLTPGGAQGAPGRHGPMESSRRQLPRATGGACWEASSPATGDKQ